ncbi:MAG: hypothetical protein K0Q68_2715 [Moraxellaceae bacterium]|nr:hypothetical protein [Moraxellaceae bacterium]
MGYFASRRRDGGIGAFLGGEWPKRVWPKKKGGEWHGVRSRAGRGRLLMGCTGGKPGATFGLYGYPGPERGCYIRSFRAGLA